MQEWPIEEEEEFGEVSPPETLPPEVERPPYVVHVPGWQDIIHLYPESLLSEEEQKRRKRERAIRIRQSPTPEIVRSIGSVLTWIDDIQDGLVTLAVLGRIAARVAPRLIPYVGWVATAADILNIMNAFGVFGMIGNVAKRGLRSSFANSLKSQKARVARAVKTGKVLPGVAEWFQILQTTDTLFGVGISLGPIVGFIEDAFFDLAAGGAGEWRSPPPNEGDLAALRIVRSYAGVSLLHQELTFEEHSQLLGANRLAVGWLSRFLPKVDWPYLTGKYIDLPMRAPGPRKETTISAIREVGLDPEETTRWPVPGSPRVITPRELQGYLQTETPGSFDKWVGDKKKTRQGQLAHLLATDIALITPRSLEGLDQPLEIKLTPKAQAAHDIQRLDLWSRAPMDKNKGMPFILEAASKLSETGLETLPPAYYRDLAKKIGL